MFEILVFAKECRVRLAVLFCLVSGLLQFSAQAQVGTPSLYATWVPSPDPAVVGYYLYYGVESGLYTNLIDVGTATNATVSGLDAGVTYYFKVTAYDGAGGESDPSNEASAVPTSTFTNQPPTLDVLSDLNINENTGPRVVNLSGISSGALSETQTLTLTASSSNPALIPTPSVIYASPNATGALTLWPATNAYGTAIITVTVDDGGTGNHTISRSFTVTVNQVVNQPPTISAIPNQNILSGTSTAPVAFTIGDAETPAGNLTLSAVSSNPALIPTGRISFGGSNATRTVSLSPLVGQSGNATITITVGDGSATASSSFQLVVRPKPVPPSNLIISAM